MRFTHPPGNLTAVFDRAEGRGYLLTNAKEAASLLELLNTMHGRIISLSVTMEETKVPTSGDNFSLGKVKPIALEDKPCTNSDCINYEKAHKPNHCLVWSEPTKGDCNEYGN